MKKLKAAVVGCGNRGCVYADYVFDEPDELEIVAVVDINPFALNDAKKRYSIPEDRSFSSLDDFLAAKVECDFVINATMDEMHYETAVKILKAGYHMLMEKPVTGKKEELLEIQRLAKEKNLKVNVCHVLRYTPYFKAIKKILNEGKLGRIYTIQMDEHVWKYHFLDSYVRGKWKSEALCGSGFLLAKSCHDTDLLCWLNNDSKPKRVTSFGSRSQFIKENAPEGATEYCYNCPHNDTCFYSAQKTHLQQDGMPFQTWAHLSKKLNKPWQELTKEEKEEDLKTSEYGLCAYNSGGDITDRQSLIVEYENGAIGTFTMVGDSCFSARHLHIIGQKGEIQGEIGSNCFTISLFDRSGTTYRAHKEKIDVTKDVVASAAYGGHAGGDYAIMHELVRYFNGDESSVSITKIDDSINGHLLVYAAEKSRKLGRAVTLDEIMQD